jgi:hypothetical protein
VPAATTAGHCAAGAMDAPPHGGDTDAHAVIADDDGPPPGATGGGSASAPGGSAATGGPGAGPAPDLGVWSRLEALAWGGAASAAPTRSLPSPLF